MTAGVRTAVAVGDTVSFVMPSGRRDFGFVTAKLARGRYWKVRCGNGVEHRVAARDITVECP